MTSMPINTSNNSASDDSGQREGQRPAPYHGERAADLIYDTQAGARFISAVEGGERGAWIYPACYDEYWLAKRRAASLARGWGLRFAVGLFGADGDAGEVTPSIAVAEPGYYAYTLADPRPRVIIIVAVEEESEGEA
ncbi:MAG TPA: hypothetical protein VF739_14035 [Ktedonobacterales bacterium]